MDDEGHVVVQAVDWDADTGTAQQEGSPEQQLPILQAARFRLDADRLVGAPYRSTLDSGTVAEDDRGDSWLVGQMTA